MSAIKSKHTRPELAVRAILRKMGRRYRLHTRGLPGKPDIVLPKQNIAIFVHGCFWHTHRCRYGKVVPSTNARFWQSKRQANVQRDKRNRNHLRRMGWQVLVVWECWTKKSRGLPKRLAAMLKDS